MPEAESYDADSFEIYFCHKIGLCSQSQETTRHWKYPSKESRSTCSISFKLSQWQRRWTICWWKAICPSNHRVSRCPRRGAAVHLADLFWDDCRSTGQPNVAAAWGCVNLYPKTLHSFFPPSPLSLISYISLSLIQHLQLTYTQTTLCKLHKDSLSSTNFLFPLIPISLYTINKFAFSSVMAWIMHRFRKCWPLSTVYTQTAKTKKRNCGTQDSRVVPHRSTD